MPIACPVDLNTSVLRSEISSIYGRVAAEPGGEFHFHRGPAYAAEFLGYDAGELATLPPDCTASFAGVGNPLAIGPIHPGQTVLDIGCGAGMDLLLAAKLPERPEISGSAAARTTASTLRELASEMEKSSPRLEDLERRLTVLEEKLFAVLLAATPDDDIVQVRAEADRELSPYRRRMPAAQIDQLQKQYLHKRLLEKYSLPRLSLFYM